MNCANHPDRERVAFCQNCGKPICQECTRIIGSAIFCEPCLAARLTGTTPASASSGSSYNFTGTSNGVNYAIDGVGPPPQPGAPSPGLATLLGFIPGVGAMYNGQYAKGIVHLVVFAILVSLANENNIFGLFVAGWIIYQAIDANHTARARLAGTALPNPFGLNDLGERLGFGKAWPSAAATPPTPGTIPVPPPNPVASYSADPYGNVTYVGTDGSRFTQTATGGQTYTAPGVPPIPPGNESYSTSTVTPPMPPYGVPAIDPTAYTRNRFPTGAIWLIGLGCLFLIGNSGFIHGFPMHRLLPFFLIGLGIWLFTRKMMDTGYNMADDGTPMYRMRLLSAARGSVWIVLVGILFFLDTFHILPWKNSWPLFIIVGGLMTFFRHAAYTTASAPGYPYVPPPDAPPPAQPANPTSIVPVDSHDQEGS